MARGTIEQQTAAVRHALSIVKRTGAMGSPALDWLADAVETLAYIERQPTFARAMAVMLAALPGTELVGVREVDDGADGVGAVRADRAASE